MLPCYRVTVLPCYRVTVLPCYRVTVFIRLLAAGDIDIVGYYDNKYYYSSCCQIIQYLLLQKTRNGAYISYGDRIKVSCVHIYLKPKRQIYNININ